MSYNKSGTLEDGGHVGQVVYYITGKYGMEEYKIKF